MKKMFLFLILVASPVLLKAECFLPELKVSYYLFNEKKLRDIYGSGGALYQGELNYKLCRNLFLYADGGYLQKHGKSLGFHQRTKICIAPISLGVKYHMCLCDCLNVYLGGGLRYFIVNIHNDSDYVRRHVRCNGLGGVFSGGVLFRFQKCFVFNPFIEYSYRGFSFHESREDVSLNIRRHFLNAGGVSFGAGIGYSF